MLTPLDLLQRRITDFWAAPVGTRDVLFGRLQRALAPVLEEREQLLDKIKRGYDWIDAHPDVADRAEREEQWATRWLFRYEKIEAVLTRYPTWDSRACCFRRAKPKAAAMLASSQASAGAHGTRQPPGSKSTTARTNRSLAPTAQPP